MLLKFLSGLFSIETKKKLKTFLIDDETRSTNKMDGRPGYGGEFEVVQAPNWGNWGDQCPAVDSPSAISADDDLERQKKAT